jgi:hypothetical protein
MVCTCCAALQGDALTRVCEAAAGALVAQQMVGCSAAGPAQPKSPERAFWWEHLSKVRGWCTGVVLESDLEQRVVVASCTLTSACLGRCRADACRHVIPHAKELPTQKFLLQYACNTHSVAPSAQGIGRASVPYAALSAHQAG